MNINLTPNEETLKRVRAEIGADDKSVNEAVQIILKWISLQPHLPNEADEAYLERLYMRCKCSVEKCKEAIDMYYTMRTAIPEFFCNRDPLQPWFKVASNIRCFFPLPRLTEDCDRINLLSCLDADPNKYIVNDIIKMIFMVIDIRAREDVCVSDYYIVDLENVTVAHAVKYTPPILRKLQITGVKAFKARIKGIHFLNAPFYVDTSLQLFKSLLKPKLAARVHVHRKGSNSLQDYISTKILPQEYGGEAPPIPELWDQWKKKLESYRQWFLDQENLKADESRRPGKPMGSNDLFGFEGTFRQLSLD